MSFIFYNTNTQTTFNLHNSPYSIDGQSGVLPSEIVELQVVQQTAPTGITGLNTISGTSTIDLTSNTITYSWNIVPVTDLNTAKQMALNILNTNFSAVMQSGITPQNLTRTLACQDSDRNSFIQLVGLLREYELLLPTESQSQFEQSEIQIADISGSLFPLTVTAFREAIVSYGNQYNNVWGQYVTQKNLINNSTGIDQIII